MRNFFVCLLMIFSIIECQARVITTQTPIRNHHYYPPIQRGIPVYNHYKNDYFNTIPKQNLNALEKYALKKSYPRENEVSRLERLESLAFGSIQQGDIETRYKNVENAILSKPQNNYKNSVLNNLTNFFAGQMTGYTPNIIPNYSYNSYYGPEYEQNHYKKYSNGIFNNGYRLFNSSNGTGSSVHLLD